MGAGGCFSLILPSFSSFPPVFPCFPSPLSQLMVVAMLSAPAVSVIAGERRRKEHP